MLESLVEWDGRAEKRVYSSHYTRLGGFGLVFVVFFVCQQIFPSLLEYFLPPLVDIMNELYVFSQ